MLFFSLLALSSLKRITAPVSMKPVLYFVKVVENERRSDPPDESPLLLSAAA